MTLQQALKKAGFSNAPTCPYCNNKAELVTGEAIYPHRPDLFNLQFWQCKPCNAYVGCHKDSDAKPLGRLADANLRELKSKAHRSFDPIWKHGTKTRKEAYKWLADELNIEVSSCHIGMFNTQQCRQVINVCYKYDEN